MKQPGLACRHAALRVGEFEVATSGGIWVAIRGVLESACDWGYPDTLPGLVQARTQPVVLVCRSGNRTALAALTLQQMGYEQVSSLKTGVRGWNDFELPLVNNQGEPVDIDVADEALSPPVLPTQMAPSLVKTS